MDGLATDGDHASQSDFEKRHDFFFLFKNDLIFQWTSLNDDSVTGLVCNMSENRQKMLINCFPGSKHLFYFDSTLSKSVDLHGGRHKLDVYC